MITTNNIFSLIQLAEASYTLFDLSGYVTDEQARAGLTDKDSFKGEFSNFQASIFVSQWNVAHHQRNTVSGFSATLFASKENPGEVVLAIRGTEPFVQAGRDLSVDIGDIVLDGLALYQIIDLYNYWQYLSAPAGVAYAAARFVDFNPLQHSLDDAIIDLPSGRIMTIERGSSTSFFAGTDRALALGAASSVTKVTVTGHSLGGHLAAAFTRLFPSTGADAVLANGAGFVTTHPNVDRVFRLLNGTTAFDAGRITNVFANRGPEIVAQDWYLQQGGGRHPVFSETAIGYTFGHGVGQITDSLAVYDLFIKLSSQIRNSTPAAALATLKPLFEAASAQAESSLKTPKGSGLEISVFGMSPI
ncbi:MAG: hypothetical protein Q8K18_19700 [Burkholderiales bacterium]|nr:hypothetical protein [Burkholderiales bacterium]